MRKSNGVERTRQARGEAGEKAVKSCADVLRDYYACRYKSIKEKYEKHEYNDE